MSYQGICLLIMGLLLMGCIASSKLSVRFSMPCLIFFLIIGFGLKYILTDWGYFDTGWGSFFNIDWVNANNLGSIALCYILFSGGYDSSLKDINKVKVPGTIMSTAGVLLTALLLGLFAYSVTCWFIARENRLSLLCQCMLFGAIISSTDASAVFSILRSKMISLDGNIKPMLEYESGSNDPMATFLTTFFLNLSLTHGLGGTGSILWFLPSFLWQIIGGCLFGWLLAKAAVWIFNHIDLNYDGMYHVMGMGVVLIIYALTTLINANGFMAVYVAGIIMGNSRFFFHNSFGRFSDALAWLMQVVLFTMLGLKADWIALKATLPWAVLFAVFLMFIARPLATYACLHKSQFTNRAKMLISWVGLRGGAPIMLATFPMIYEGQLELTGTNGQIMMNSGFIFHTVFVMVLLSVVCQSFTIMPLARRLHLDTPLDIIPPSPITFEQVSFKDKGTKHADTADSSTDDDDYADTSPQEFSLPRSSVADGKTLQELGLPKGAFVIMIRRGEKYIVPHGNTIIRGGDTLTIMANDQRLKETGVLLGC